ncbi:MAG: hypothetical protein LBS36_07665 [Oscillospiraceae bacterium]|jgi:hypothetical protein|nr:hypothetical protein [Oscillospiraceae bacterium]
MTKTEQAISEIEYIIKEYDRLKCGDNHVDMYCGPEFICSLQTALAALKTQQAVDEGRVVELPCILDASRIAYIKSIIDSQIKYAEEALRKGQSE